jgi:hypothetical protein
MVPAKCSGFRPAEGTGLYSLVDVRRGRPRRGGVGGTSIAAGWRPRPSCFAIADGMTVAQVAEVYGAAVGEIERILRKA